MIRKSLNRLNPTRQLPQPMRRYLGLPNWLFMAWLVISGAVLIGPALLRAKTTAQENSPAQSEPVEIESSVPVLAEPDSPATEAPMVLAMAGDLDGQLRPGAGIYVTGSANFSLQRNGERVELTQSDQPLLRLEGDGESLRLRTEQGQLAYRLKVKEEDQGKVYDEADNFLFRLKCEAEDREDACKLYGPTGEKLSRVKFKADSFNVYGADGQRLYKGKLKHGAWEAKDEAGRTVLSLRGARSLREAALLALPVEPAVRVLLWRHAGR